MPICAYRHTARRRGRRKVTHLILGRLLKELAVEVGGEGDATGRGGVLGGDDVGEVLGAIGRGVDERVLLDVPIEGAEGGDYVRADEGVVRGVG